MVEFSTYWKKGIHLLFLLMISASVAYGQSTVSGTVTDESGDGLPGVSILIKGTSTGTITNVMGEYKIAASPSDVIIVSFVGYTSQEVAVGSRSTINVTLGEDVTTLQELVVTGYSVQSKRNISGSVASVDPKELKDMPVSNVAQAIQGRVSGVQVTSSGSPGGGISLRIRGFGTINDNEPLYIIDGLPATPRAVQDINPNDIESMQVLKDASAASIYGSRAANGVVIITTKKGDPNGKTNITLDMFTGIQSPGEFPSLLTPQQLADATFVFNGGPAHPQYGTGSSATLPTYIIPTAASTADESTYDLQSNRITRASQSGVDYFDEVFDAAPITSINIGGTGGNQQAQYALSAGYYDQEGTVINTGYKRVTLRANTVFRALDGKLRIGENLSASFSDSYGGAGDGQNSNSVLSMVYRFPSIIPIYDVGGNFAGTGASGFNNPDNPVAQLTRNRDNHNKQLRILGGAYAEFDIIEGLTAKTAFNVELGTTYENKSYGIRNIESAEPSANNTLNQRFDNSLNWTWYNTLTYDKTIGNDHNFTILAGTEAIENEYTFMGGGRVNFFSDNQDYRQLSVGEAGISNFGNKAQSSLFSVFGKIDYNFAGKYIVSATIRRDGSSRFGAGNRYGVFPAFSAAWRISEEAFMQDVSAVSDLKLRVGWGQTGNQSIGNYTFASTFALDESTSAYGLGGGNAASGGFQSAVFGNPDVKWEATTSLNIGFDATLFNALDVSFDWYTRDTDDMLIRVPRPSLSGIASSPFVNVGEMNNTGIDLSMNYASNNGGDLNWNVGLVFSAYKNEVVALADSLQVFNSGGFREYAASRTSLNQPIGSFYGWDIEGIFQTQAEVDAHATQDGAAPGRFKYRDIDGDGAITPDDRGVIGTPHPDFTFGVNLGLNYRNFDLGLFFQGTQGNDVFNGNLLFTDFFNYFTGSQKGTAVLDSWGYPGANNASATLPQLSANAPSRELEPSTYYIEDGSYIRLKTLSIGYSIPTVKNIGMESLRVYLQGTNVFTITDYSGLDPEVGPGSFYNSGADLGIGVDRGNYPIVQTWSVGVSATF